MTHHLSSSDTSIFAPEISNLLYRKIKVKILFLYIFSIILLTFIETINDVLVNQDDCSLDNLRKMQKVWIISEKCKKCNKIWFPSISRISDVTEVISKWKYLTLFQPFWVFQNSKGLQKASLNWFRYKSWLLIQTTVMDILLPKWAIILQVFSLYFCFYLSLIQWKYNTDGLVIYCVSYTLNN